MPAEIPGYYFDPEKNKYFKIEHASTAPRAAAWSADSVKRRRVAAESSAAADDRARLLRRHIRRWRQQGQLTGDTITRALLQRELGDKNADSEADVRAAVWASGAVDKGSVSLARGTRSANMPCMYVNGDDTKTGLGVVYATLGEERLVGSYIPTDDNDTITFSATAPLDSGRSRALHTEFLRFPQLSSITYHAPSHRIIATSRSPNNSVYLFSPHLSEEADVRRPRWLLGRLPENGYHGLCPNSAGSAVAHTAAPAPTSSSSRLLCLVGTNVGVLRVNAGVSDHRTLSWVGERVPLKPTPGAAAADGHPRETLALDFLHNHPEVFLAGGRRSQLWITDMRAPPSSTSHRVGSGQQRTAVAHLRSVSEHLLLTAGPPSSMATYDTRFLRSPVVRFDEYRNEAHVHAGWDVCAELGLVAAAHDDGTVKLFSLGSGRRCRPEAGGGLDGVRTDAPIRALSFRRMPRERLPSLFVGEGAVVRKFSLGVRALGNEA
ncbi:WD40 repeat-like-containing domain protein [Cordyceps fumosorosea ARSEF 2679]|uniref:WD40 repeat-like-containing domain protein n=1 Tax=Cordyceps fumosorosea (strain ARSEF 2679) TaxID=1081104 RepID=A0A168CC72_CORFA|nr:WD40 repeat-like-containing domain protein [Cordyceps fumosorosea ARSEF 2679]OAA71211.1 WD40 repeat-like-containing domain protein [Cordyceps fumosorosea ARSEF 2679]